MLNNKKTVAILLTVFNRKDVTLAGLKRLSEITTSSNKYHFDIYMTDDGCTDGTTEAVLDLYSDIRIINGDGSLYWSGGMRAAWEFALHCYDYDYYIWYNDDALLFDDAFVSLFEPLAVYGDKVVVSGAFCSEQGEASYGGRDFHGKILTPNNSLQDIYLLNGNLVLIPRCVYQECGNISKIYKHGEGDWDYGMRCRNKNIPVVLTKQYVGITNRHDNILPKYCQKKFSFIERIQDLYGPKVSILSKSYLFAKLFGFAYSIKFFFNAHKELLFPSN